MNTMIIDGKQIAEDILAQIKMDVRLRLEQGKSIPGLATLLIGEDPASNVYVSSKHRACEGVGFKSFSYKLPENAKTKEIIDLINKMNTNKEIHGILVQLPLPKSIDEEKVLSHIKLEKDVDGFHPVNIGRLAQKGREPVFVPCTPAGVMYLLEKTGINLSGANAVVLGRSNIVGMPVALLLLKANATVTICHSKTKDLKSIVREADVIIAAIGIPEMIKKDWVKPGVVVIDVGINRIEDASKKRGYRLVGDVDYNDVLPFASAITPVPGGVGPLTIAMLLKNTLLAAKLTDKS